MSKILIVEDDVHVRTLLRTMLNTIHYIYDVGDIATAREEVEHKPFDLVLIDQQLPDGTGLELAEHLQAEQVSFIFISSDDSPDVVRAATDLGALCFITKPFDIEKAAITIDGAINQAMEKRKTNRDLVVNVAVGLMMERGSLVRKDAYKKLRDRARERNLKLMEAAEELIIHVEVVNYYLS